jgi:hypothetical protein
VKIIKVESCLSCPFQGYDQCQEDFYCEHKSFKASIELRDISNIPPWCPLDDADGQEGGENG